MVTYNWEHSNFNSSNCVQVAREVGLRTEKFILADTLDTTVNNYQNVIRVSRYDTADVAFKKIIASLLAICANELDETSEKLDETDIEVISYTAVRLFNGLNMDSKSYLSFIKRYTNILQKFNSLIRIVQTTNDENEEKEKEKEERCNNLNKQCKEVILRTHLLEDMEGNKFDEILGQVGYNTGLAIHRKSKPVAQREDGHIYASEKSPAIKQSSEIINAVSLQYLTYYKGVFDRELGENVATILTNAVKGQRLVSDSLIVGDEKQLLDALELTVTIMTSDFKF